jgi:hypothetical protein
MGKIAASRMVEIEILIEHGSPMVISEHRASSECNIVEIPRQHSWEYRKK